MQEAVWQLAKEAGAILMGYFRSPTLKATTKDDKSPVTAADMAASTFLVRELEKLSGDPVLSEERILSFAERQKQKRIWIVDPLDGTKDFLAGINEFAVNIALIENAVPILGCIYAPALEELFFAEKGKGAFVERKKKREKLPLGTPKKMIAATSRFHPSKTYAAFLEKNKITDLLSIGASLKFCRIAEGVVSLFGGFGYAGEWDTAPGQLILEEAGGKLVSVSDLKPLTYNKLDLHQPPYLACGSTVDPLKLRR